VNAEALSAARKHEALNHALGERVLAALADPLVVEVLANPDGRLVVDRLRTGRTDAGIEMTAQARERVIRLIADYVGEPITRDDPRLSGVLPTGERFQGFLPPVCAQPAFSIRKRPAVIWTLDDYVASGVLSLAQGEVLRDAVRRRRNVLVSGGAGSGKTTLANAILAEPDFRNDRVFLIEDTPELQCSAWDLVGVLTRRHPRPITVADLVRDALRMRPDRIVVGEMRDGAAALEALKAWNTGHPGGVSTIHANSAGEALLRLEDLLREVMLQPSARMIGQAVDLVVHIGRRPEGRAVDTILEVAGLDPDGAYRLQSLEGSGASLFDN
jgi:type IV secretion system protein VirB11